ncbi:hypothetical protein SUGI_0702210 [Cryptomeria japonica]|nr:hypothetical protein SUGI_0702210 [Cryptomeria japonica]
MSSRFERWEKVVLRSLSIVYLLRSFLTGYLGVLLKYGHNSTASANWWTQRMSCGDGTTLWRIPRIKPERELHANIVKMLASRAKDKVGRVG